MHIYIEYSIVRIMVLKIIFRERWSDIKFIKYQLFMTAVHAGFT